ncbi:MAG: ATP-binding protein [Cytophagales bacterium]|uniref:Schlafen AlbA-2 domain-containing protein n=1 Tax=Algoriphagus taiwanensis TaxID=1445656 RepID=A0ABQ6PYU2_9BACT|nr:MAG: ATP-binding protein [Cytophagales bacterium]GMQ32787.1 hypothetical protein Ataiwa_10590 [Algoriphagus taiwanensis]
MNPTKFDEDFVKKLIKQKEGKSLDFKNKITSKEKIAKTLVAFANTMGGYLLIGVSDKKQLRGIDPEEEKYMIDAANQDYCIPQVNLSHHEVKLANPDFPENSEEEEIYLLLVRIEPHPYPPVMYKNMNGENLTYIRQGDRTVVLRN